MSEGIVLSMVLTSHIGWTGNFNDIHPSIAYEYNSYSVGLFRNSLNRTSLFVSKTSKFDDVSVQYGLANNYNGKVIPMIIVKKPIVDHVNAVFMPSYDTAKGNAAAVVGIEILY